MSRPSASAVLHGPREGRAWRTCCRVTRCCHPWRPPDLSITFGFRQGPSEQGPEYAKHQRRNYDATEGDDIVDGRRGVVRHRFSAGIGSETDASHGLLGGSSHQMVQTLAAWIKTIEEASGGNLTVEVDKAALGKMEGQYDLIRNGVRDSVWAVPGYTVGRFDMLQAAELPLPVPEPGGVQPGAVEVVRKARPRRQGIHRHHVARHLHGRAVPGPHRQAGARRSTRSRRSRSAPPAPSLPMAKALGLNAVPLPANETYEAVQRGTVDGSVFPWEAMTSFRLNELLKGHLEVPGGLGAPSFVIVANTKAFDNLTAENKAALMKASGEAGVGVDRQGMASRRRARPQRRQGAGPGDRDYRAGRVRALAVPAAGRDRRMDEEGRSKGYDGRKMLDDLQGDDQGGVELMPR